MLLGKPGQAGVTVDALEVGGHVRLHPGADDQENIPEPCRPGIPYRVVEQGTAPRTDRVELLGPAIAPGETGCQHDERRPR